METLQYVLQVFTPENLWVLLIGVIGGTVIGALPGLTATMGVALLIPMTFGMTPVMGLNMLLGIYIGGIYGGCISSILVKTPGTPASAATVLDGYPLAQKGEAKKALGMATMASFIGGVVSSVILVLMAPMLAEWALKFGPPEYFAVAMLGLACIASISGKSMLKGVIASIFGMALGMIGMDPIAGIPRFTFDSVDMMGGMALIPTLVGFFAITEVLAKADDLGREKPGEIGQVKEVIPKMSDLLAAKWTLIKSTMIGIIIGAIPGTGPTIASWMSYNEAKRGSKHPEEFGHGSAEGVMACESANNAVTGGALIPLLTLGIPGDGVTAVLLGALMIQGLTPGPMMLSEKYDLVAVFLWVLIFANLFMLAIGLLGSKLFPIILRMPMQILVPLIVVLCIAGSYASNNSFFDVKVAVVLGTVGFVMLKCGFPVAPIVLGYILGPIIEPNFRLAMIGSGMDPTVFFTNPLSCFFLVLAVVLSALIYRRMNAS